MATAGFLKFPSIKAIYIQFDFMLILLSSSISITGVVDDGRQLKPFFSSFAY
jgi:hypothetical protein